MRCFLRYPTNGSFFSVTGSTVCRYRYHKYVTNQGGMCFASPLYIALFFNFSFRHIDIDSYKFCDHGPMHKCNTKLIGWSKCAKYRTTTLVNMGKLPTNR